MRPGHYGTPALAALLGSVALLVVHLAVPFGIVDRPASDNDAGIDDQTVSAGDVAADFDDDRYGLPDPAVAFWGILLALLSGALLLGLGLAPMGVTTARFTGWLLAVAGATGAWLALASSAYWLGTGSTTLLGVVSQNPPAARLWPISPVPVAAGALALAWTFLRVATGVVSRRDGLRDEAERHTRVSLLAGVLLLVLLAMPWSFQILDGDERRDHGDCSAAAVCPGRIDWYSAWGASADAELAALQSDPAGSLFTSHADGLYGGILAVAGTGDRFGLDLWRQTAFSLKVLTAAAWTSFFVGATATLGHVVASAGQAPRAPRAATTLHLPALLVLAWATVHYLLLAAYQWRPTYDDGLLPDAQSWWFAFAPFAAAPLLVALAFRQWRLVRPLLSGLKTVARERAETAHTFD